MPAGSLLLQPLGRGIEEVDGLLQQRSSTQAQRHRNGIRDRGGIKEGAEDRRHATGVGSAAVHHGCRLLERDRCSGGAGVAHAASTQLAVSAVSAERIWALMPD